MISGTPLVTTDWLSQHLSDPDLIVLDASLPKPKSDPADNPLSSIQIKGSRFFDIDHVFSDQSSELPHMMPPTEQLEKEARQLGINNHSTLIVYDNLGVYSSPRAWWMLKAMGHDKVFVLDGGLPQWVNEKYPTETKQGHSWTVGNFSANPNEGYFVDSTYVLDSMKDASTCTLDARSKGRFQGTEPEPRAGLRGGHIPNSKNLPFPDVIEGNKMKSKDDLINLFDEVVDQDQALIFSCGSGLTACIILLAAEIAGYKRLSVYDGSWSEWGKPSDLPVESG